METLLEPGMLVDNRYRVIRELGQGGFATVYAAEHTSLGRPAALKVLDIQGRVDDRFIKRFEREARIAANFEHDNVVRIFDFGIVEATNQPFMAMEMLEGWDLEQELRVNGAMSPERAVRLFEGALDALALAHSRGIIHKDLKPSNLFIAKPATHDERLVILDFGIARIDDDATKLTQTGAFAGTPAYLAPEYIQDQVVTPAFDVYQMGLIFTETLTGTQVVHANSSVAYLMKHIQGEFEIPPEVTRSVFGPLLAKAIATDPAHRYPNAGVFHSALVSLKVPESLGLTGQRLMPVPAPEDISGLKTLDSKDAVSLTGEAEKPTTSPSQKIRAIESAPTIDGPVPAPRAQTQIEERTEPIRDATSTQPAKKRSFALWFVLFLGLGGVAVVGLLVFLVAVAIISEEDTAYVPPPPELQTRSTADESATYEDTVDEKLRELSEKASSAGLQLDPEAEKLSRYISAVSMTTALDSATIVYRESVERAGLDKPRQIIPPVLMNEIWDHADVALEQAATGSPRLEELDKAALRFRKRLVDYAQVQREIHTFYENEAWQTKNGDMEARRHWAAFRREATRTGDARDSFVSLLYGRIQEIAEKRSTEGEGYVAKASQLMAEVATFGNALFARKPDEARRGAAAVAKSLENFEDYARQHPDELHTHDARSAIHAAIVQTARQIPRDLKRWDRASASERRGIRVQLEGRVHALAGHWSSLLRFHAP